MRRQQHYYGLNHLHFLTSSTYRRARLFDSERLQRRFVDTLDELRSEFEFRIIGYVLMPEHFHLLLWPSEHRNPSEILQSLKERTAKFILGTLRENLHYPWCQRMLNHLALPSSVHHHARYRVWQRKFYDLNVWSEKKRLEKLNYMHNNPVKRGLVAEVGDWPWSSWRFYYRGDASVLAIDRMPCSHTWPNPPCMRHPRIPSKMSSKRGVHC